ncbi:helix-turn-helix transcriptional regulator [Rhodoferax mekongensis]|uniref:helix-turn-helix transcriptional regulator n=1 Tax=Rhodoferax mekongensis TaxID=3068341 RepID=UPI0028BF1AAB|nr:AlpA family transcriptional regulator [Rhodoferax sp. TBRC 17199]MDT7514551.1 AlpA family transcriptional regulator [Rhodoferax sp. TBRC 17199]
MQATALTGEGTRILRMRDVLTRTGLSRTSVYHRIKGDDFPAPVQLGPRAIGFVEAEVNNWISRLIEASRQGAK